LSAAQQMKAPWFLGYSNGMFAAASALMFLYGDKDMLSIHLARENMQI
jgi:hypothetical protein